MTAANTLDWLLDDMIARLPGVRYSVVLSTGGLLLGRSAALTRDDAERFCAMASAVHGLARGAGLHFQAGDVCQTMIELDHAVLFITAAGPTPAWPCSPTRPPTSVWRPTRSTES
ncbi:roadblock/LC7 domain-containing protein [Nocardia sp. NPDC059091]|uniref:roadblock/LC7 domain-containing protein n=1 Tax=unclassified Nocardia TaxID=2637762 RepID=UPI003694A266